MKKNAVLTGDPVVTKILKQVLVKECEVEGSPGNVTLIEPSPDLLPPQQVADMLCQALVGALVFDATESGQAMDAFQKQETFLRMVCQILATGLLQSCVVIYQIEGVIFNTALTDGDPGRDQFFGDLSDQIADFLNHLKERQNQ